LEGWQLRFRIKGLVAPLEEIILHNILIRGIPPHDVAEIYVRVAVREEKWVRKEFLKFLKKDKILEKILQIYGLVSNVYAEVPLTGGYAKISSETPFGDCGLGFGQRCRVILDEDTRKRQTPFLQKTFDKYEATKSVWKDSKRGFLRNAIDYYHRSLRNHRLEDRLIDLMVSFESLFSKELDELRLRVSLRASFFVGIGNEDERLIIYKNVKALYIKRSKIIHGVEDVKLNPAEIGDFQEIVREAIKRFLYIEESKDEILELLDQSVVDEGKLSTLIQIVSEAISKW